MQGMCPRGEFESEAQSCADTTPHRRPQYARPSAMMSCLPGVLTRKGLLRDFVDESSGSTSTSSSSSPSWLPLPPLASVPPAPPLTCGPGVATAAAAAAASALIPPSSPVEADVEGVTAVCSEAVVELAPGVVPTKVGSAAAEGVDPLADPPRRRRPDMNLKLERPPIDRPVAAECVEGVLINLYAKNCNELWLVCREICEAKSAFKFGFSPLQFNKERSQASAWLRSPQDLLTTSNNMALANFSPGRPYSMTRVIRLFRAPTLRRSDSRLPSQPDSNPSISRARGRIERLESLTPFCVCTIHGDSDL